MNFMSYVAEVSRGWDEPNAKDMGRMTSQPNAKGEMYIFNDGIDMKANIATMARRLEELEMKKMDHPISLGNHSHLSTSNLLKHFRKPQLEQAMVNLSKVVGDFVGAQKSINAQLSQRIDSVEMQETGNFPSQPYQNSKGIHEVEAQKGESLTVKEVKTVITLRSGKEVDLPTSKLEHKVTSQKLARGKLVHLHGRRSLALPSVGSAETTKLPILAFALSPATLAPRNKKPSHPSSEETSFRACLASE
ncbi:hypothetical protein CK203_105253 [Vitis vinifera]|uniref:Uncharacterized protein n=1 Tax=Vitis vinifera TaxID=29760 RepID=A0A438FGN5_VITVI|nr:hypothetical protein CK203_105253 [Vitis vinifera]